MNTIKIGNQEWTTENLKLYDKGLGKDHWVSKLTGETFYSLNAAVRIVSEQAKGFHIPSAEEWDELAKTCGCVLIPTEVNYFKIEELKEYKQIEILKEKLNISLTGCYDIHEKEFIEAGDVICFWTTSIKSPSFQYVRCVDEETIAGKYLNVKHGASIRLVKDV